MKNSCRVVLVCDLMTSFRKKGSIWGVIIPLSCAWMLSYASFSPPPPGTGNAMEIPRSTHFDLGPEENSKLGLGQTAWLTCSRADAQTGGDVYWYRDGEHVGRTALKSSQQQQRAFMEQKLRELLPDRNPRIHSTALNTPTNETTSAVFVTSPNAEYTVFRNGTLRIGNVTNSDAGEYSCFIEDYQGTLLRRKFNVSISEPPRCILSPAIKQSAYLHSNARLLCSANFDDVARLTWEKDGKLIPDGGLSHKFNILGNGALHIFNLTDEDSGSFKCRVKSSLGWTDCGPVVLEVMRKEIRPHDFAVIHVPENITVRPPHDVAYLECLTNNINSNYAWTKVGPDLICGSSYCPPERLLSSPRNNNLVLKRVSTSDMGYYKCITRIVDNSTIRKEAIMYLDVLTKPEVRIGYRTKGVLLAKRIKITCNVEYSNPRARVYWMKDGELVAGLHGNGISVVLIGEVSHLTISSVESSHEGYYQCVAVNSVGAYSAETFLQVPKGVPPPTPQNLTAVALSPTDIHVSWDYPNLTEIHSFLITYEKDYGPLKSEPVDDMIRHYEINDLRPYSNYTIKITAYTKHSPSETSRVRVQTLEGTPCGSVQHISVLTINTTSILVWWKSLPMKDRCGVITQYQVIHYDPVIPKQNIDYVDSRQDPNDEGTVTEYRLYVGLKPGTRCAFSVTPLTSIGFGQESMFEDGQTLESTGFTCLRDGRSVFRAIRGAMDYRGKIKVSWSMRTNVSLGQFHVDLMGMDGRMLQRSESTPLETEKIFQRPDEQPVYIVRVTVLDTEYSACETRKLVIQSNEKSQDENLRLPEIRSCEKLGPRCVAISWKYPSSLEVVFSVRYRTLEANRFRYRNTSKRQAKICGLSPGTNYELGVGVLVSAGQALDEVVYVNADAYVKTEETQPGPPRRLTCTYEGRGSAFCTWTIPILPNGEIRNYTLQYRERSRDIYTQLHTDDTNFLLECLRPDTGYAFQVRAVNYAAASDFSTSSRLHIPAYDTVAENCTAALSEMNRIQQFANSTNSPNPFDPVTGMDDVTFGVVLASIIVVIVSLLVLALVCICLPEIKAFRKKDNTSVGRYLSKDESGSNGVVKRGRSRQNGNEHLEFTSEQKMPLRTGNRVPTNGKTRNGKSNGVTKKNGIRSTTAADDQHVKQDSRYENGISSYRKFFRNKFEKQVAAPESDINNEHMRHLILSVPIPKHCGSSSEARNSSSVSIDSWREDEV